jgi:hypothetical protein
MTELQKKIKFLETELVMQEYLNSELKTELNLQADQLLRLKSYIGIQEILNPFYKEFMTLSACNLLIDPNPVDLKCGGEKTGHHQIFPVRVIDILAIESKGKYKKIYLKNKIKPNDGGKGKKELDFCQDGVGLDKLLFIIQKSGHHLLQVQKSWCINLYHYSFDEKNHFHLKDEHKKEDNSNIHSIPVGGDAVFNKNLYQQRIHEINKLKETAENSLKMFERGEEIKQELYNLGLLY